MSESDLKMRFVSNATQDARRETWQGKEWLALPVVALVSGVVNGELITDSELAAGHSSWDGRPVTLGHPTSGGRFVSANKPDVLDRYGVGQLFNTSFAESRLKTEAWIDIERAERTDDGKLLLERAEGGEKIEVSTAYFRAVNAETGVGNDGKAYDGIAYDLKPDHLAILLHERGACSWDDGCGVRVNVLSAARRPSYSGTEQASWADVKKSFADFLAGYYKHTDASEPDEPITKVSDAPAAARRWIASKTLLGDPSADNPRDLIFFPVVNPSTDKLNAGAVRAVLGGRGAQAEIPQAALDSARKLASSLLEDEFKADVDQSALARLSDAGRQFVDSLIASLQRGDLSAQVLATSEISLDEQAARVRQAFYELTERSMQPVSEATPETWVRAVFSDRIVVERGGALYAYPYTADGESIEFGEPEQVEIEYRPVTQSSADVSAQTTTEEVSTMSELINDVAERYGVAAEDLSDVPESVLTALSEYAPEQDGQQEPQEQPCQEYAALLAYVDENGGADATLAVLKQLAEQREHTHTQLVGQLAANERCAFTRDELSAFDNETLERLARSIRPADYSGQPAQGASSTREQVYTLSEMRS